MARAKRSGRAFSIPARIRLDWLEARFGELVCAQVTVAAERRRQARLLSFLMLLGLCGALSMPLAVFGSAAPQAVVSIAILASAGFILAAVLSATGAFDAVLGLTIAIATAAIAFQATFSGGLASTTLLLLAIPLLETWRAGRRHLAFFTLGVASLAISFVAAAQWLELVNVDQPWTSIVFSCVCGLAYAGIRMERSHKARRIEEETRSMRRIETRLVENSLREGVLRFLPDGALVDASDLASAWLEAKASTATPFLLHAVHVADRVAYLKAFGDIKSGADIAACDVRLARSNDGSFIDFSLRFAAVREPGGPLASIIVFACDRTAERRRDAELNEALAAARQASDMKSGFLASVSHELRTPLNAIIGFSDVLDQELFGGFPDPRQKEYVGLIRQSGEHLLSVVNSLLDISKIEAGRYELLPEEFEVDQLIAATVATMRPEADRRGLQLEIVKVCEGQRIVADRRVLQQMLFNLVSNALKFTERGQVRIETGVCEGTIEICVTDTGIGIPAVELPRLGQPFTQVSSGIARRYPGTGLGLSLVKGFAELHGGAMTLTSEVGVGTAVTIRLPLEGSEHIEKFEETVVAFRNVRKTSESHASVNETRRSA